MKLTERQNLILQRVRRENHVEVENVARQFQVTSQTIRKDINRLCELGLLRRRYGGVSLPLSMSNVSVTSRRGLNQFAKQAMAAALAGYIPEDASVYLGVGSSVEFVARELSAHSSLKVLTNNLSVVSALSGNPGIEVLVSRGSLRHNDLDLVGHHTVEFFNDFRVDFGVIGTGSLDTTDGLMDFDERESEISRAILANSRQRILVADQSKWERAASIKVAPFSGIDLFITDSIPDDKRNALPAELKVIRTQHC
ncbi:DeoR/GlpR family DNA-binding transcription regulator [Marinobacter sp.]|uniref:DeoR/GlpR family DNA-binding transcription regulator n=1 Tax=Marinobacter sp. TaxID=50741 RepID=UPI00384EC3D9